MNERIKFIKEIIKEKEEAYDFLKETDKSKPYFAARIQDLSLFNKK